MSLSTMIIISSFLHLGFGFLRTFIISIMNSLLQPFLFLAVNDEVRKAVVNVFRLKTIKSLVC